MPYPSRLLNEQESVAVDLHPHWWFFRTIGEFFHCAGGAVAICFRPGVLTGSDEEVIDRIGQYVEAGAEQINLALRAPFDLDSVERFSHTLKLM